MVLRELIICHDENHLITVPLIAATPACRKVAKSELGTAGAFHLTFPQINPLEVDFFVGEEMVQPMFY